jgi:hypothetical protein
MKVVEAFLRNIDGALVNQRPAEPKAIRPAAAA